MDKIKAAVRGQWALLLIEKVTDCMTLKLSVDIGLSTCTLFYLRWVNH